MKFFYIFLFIFLYNLLTNLYNLYRINLLNSHFVNWLKNSKDTQIFIERQEVLNLFKIANVEDRFVPTTKFTGFGKIAQFNTSVQTNFPNNSPEIVVETSVMFLEARGVFQNRVKNCINPLYWTKIVLFFPTYLLKYLGMSTETIIFRFFNLFLTFIFWGTGLFFTLFQDEIKTFISSYFP